MRVIVTGSRHMADAERVCQVLNQYKITVLVHGACRTGADKLADEWARSNPGIEIERYPARWERYGDAAGPIRNEHMVKLGADICVAFLASDSRGTKNCIALARRYNIKTEIYYV